MGRSGGGPVAGPACAGPGAGLLGQESVQVPVLSGGRGPAERITLTPLGDEPVPCSAPDRPWPGQLPEPSPAVLLDDPVELLDARGDPVRVNARGLFNTEPARLDGAGYRGAGLVDRPVAGGRTMVGGGRTPWTHRPGAGVGFRRCAVAVLPAAPVVPGGGLRVSQSAGEGSHPFDETLEERRHVHLHADPGVGWPAPSPAPVGDRHPRSAFRSTPRPPPRRGSGSGRGPGRRPRPAGHAGGPGSPSPWPAWNSK